MATISLSEYKTEDYAKALQMYNQNHPCAGDAMRRDERGPVTGFICRPAPSWKKGTPM